MIFAGRLLIKEYVLSNESEKYSIRNRQKHKIT